MVLGCLHSAYLREHTRYLGGRKRLPLCPPTAPTRKDRIFAALRRDVINPRAWEASKNVWILATTWRLVDKRVSARQDIKKDQALIRRLSRAIKASLREDRKRRAEEVGAEVKTLLGLDPPLHREAWHRIKGWYKAALSRPLGLPSSGSWRRGWSCTATYRPRGRTSPFPCSHYRWTTWCLRRTR